MLLVCKSLNNGSSLPELEFELRDSRDKITYCRATATYLDKDTVSLCFKTPTKYQQRGYATKAARMMVSWALHSDVRKLIIANPDSLIAIDKIAVRATFIRGDGYEWIKITAGLPLPEDVDVIVT